MNQKNIDLFNEEMKRHGEDFFKISTEEIEQCKDAYEEFSASGELGPTTLTNFYLLKLIGYADLKLRKENKNE